MSTLLRRTLLPRATTNHHLHHLSFYSTTPTTTDPAVETAVSTLTHHRSKSRWSTLKTLFPNGLTSQQISQITLLLRNNPHLALRFFHFSSRHFHNSSLHSYATIIHTLARARQTTRTHTLTREAIRVSAGKHLYLFKILVQTYRQCDSAPFVFDLFITCLLDSNYLDSALEIIRKLNSRGNYLTVRTINALLSTASKRKGGYFAFDLYKEMFFGRIVPNVETFNELLLSFHRDGVVEMVEEVWIEMVKGKCSGNCFSFCVLLEAYCEGGDVEKAREVFEEMKLTGVGPDVVAYNTLIGGYCKTGEVEKGEELVREMGLRGLEGSCVTDQHLVNGYCLTGDVDSAMLLWNAMRKKGYCPDSVTVDAMVRLLCDKGCVVEAFRFFNDVMGDVDFVARETSYELLIKGLCGLGKMEEAMKLQAQMVGKGFRPNGDMYAAFIEGYMKQGKLDVAERLRKEVTGMLAS